MTTVTTSADGRQLDCAYEALRAAAMGRPTIEAPSPRGLALFLRSGLAGWLAAWVRLVATPPPSARRGSEGPTAATGLGAELATLLIQMALIAHRNDPCPADPGRPGTRTEALA